MPDIEPFTTKLDPDPTQKAMVVSEVQVSCRGRVLDENSTIAPQSTSDLDPDPDPDPDPSRLYLPR